MSFAVEESLSVGVAALSESTGVAAFSEPAAGGTSFDLVVSDGAGVAGVVVVDGLLLGGVAGAAVVGCGGAAADGCGEG